MTENAVTILRDLLDRLDRERTNGQPVRRSVAVTAQLIRARNFLADAARPAAPTSDMPDPSGRLDVI